MNSYNRKKANQILRLARQIKEVQSRFSREDFVCYVTVAKLLEEIGEISNKTSIPSFDSKHFYYIRNKIAHEFSNRETVEMVWTCVDTKLGKEVKILLKELRNA